MRKVIACVQIAGGLLGVFVMTATVARIGLGAWGATFYIFLGSFVSVLVAGILLFRAEKRGYVLSLVVQSAQVISIATPFAVIRVQAGPQLLLGVRGGRPEIYAGFDADAALMVPAPSTEPLGVVVNLAPLVAIWFLIRLQRSSPAEDGHASRE